MKVVSSRMCVCFCQVLGGIAREDHLQSGSQFDISLMTQTIQIQSTIHMRTGPWPQCSVTTFSSFISLISIVLVNLGSYFPPEYNPLGSKFKMGEGLSASLSLGQALGFRFHPLSVRPVSLDWQTLQFPFLLDFDLLVLLEPILSFLLLGSLNTFGLLSVLNFLHGGFS